LDAKKGSVEVEDEVVTLVVERPSDSNAQPRSSMNDRGLRDQAFLICRQFVQRDLP
jgi:hypothetical protein